VHFDEDGEKTCCPKFRRDAAAKCGGEAAPKLGTTEPTPSKTNDKEAPSFLHRRASTVHLNHASRGICSLDT
jgi:hypothetical protein